MCNECNFFYHLSRLLPFSLETKCRRQKKRIPRNLPQKLWQLGVEVLCGPVQSFLCRRLVDRPTKKGLEMIRGTIPNIDEAHCGKQL